MDPSLFFAADGRVYYTRHSGGERGAIYQSELDPKSGELGETHLVWRGTGDIWPEGPHLFEIAGRYYLTIAEGGTSYGHMQTIARAASPFGPFEANPRNPILTHRARPEHPIQATGHADFVQTEAGDWWAVFLGIRPVDGQHHHIGRETFLAPVVFDEDGWPVVNGGRPVELEMPDAGLPPREPWPLAKARRDFTEEALPVEFWFLRNPSPESWSLRERRGFLRLRASAASLEEPASPALVGRRQLQHVCRAAALLDFQPANAGHEAGLCARSSEANHYRLALALRDDGARCVRLTSRIKAHSQVVAEVPVPDGPLVLGIDANAKNYRFSWAREGGRSELVGTLPCRPLSSESAGGFTGVVFGMYATRDSGRAAEPTAPADFDWFEYHDG
jgi:alpha-N-arabinofuranosidase